MNKINSSDIAKLAGVSRSTVSRVVNGYSNVPPETRERVMKIIKENNYYPLLSGQLLAGKKTGTIGFFWQADSSIADDMMTSSFFIRITEAAAANGYLVLTCIINNYRDKKNINMIKQMFMQGRIDAGIFVGTNNNEQLIDDLVGLGKIVGLFDHFHEDKQEPNRISVNFENNTGEKAIDYVCSLGHKDIAVIDGNMNRYSSMKRHESFVSAMQKHNIEIRNEWIRYGDIVESGGYRATKEILRYSQNGLPTVICANNDSAAFGVYKALAEEGISVPDQISVIGIDGHPKGQYMQPGLSTFSFNYKDLFSSLVMRTIRTVNQEADVPLTEFIPSTLVIRNSVKDLR